MPGTDLRGLSISPVEAFVVSRVDGATSIQDIAEETGKPLEEVVELLGRLALLGVLVLDEPTRSVERARRASPAPAARLSGQVRLGPIVETRADVKHPAASLYDPAELDEDVEIEISRRRQILDLFYRLDQLTHYQLFGVPPHADKKAIKAAYFEIVNVYHPDRYFGKRVGRFKAKLERVFSRLTQSYDVLSRNASRSEYDAYLQAQSKTRAFDAGQQDSAAHEAALAEVMRRIQNEASAENKSLSVPPASVPPMSAAPVSQASPSLPPRSSSNPALRPSASLRPSDPDIRRRALARKLGHASPPSSPERDAQAEAEQAQQRVELAAQDSVRQGWAADELKRRYQDRVQAARDRQIAVYTRAAKQALDKGDNVGAANALRIATSLAPDDPTLAEQLNEVAGKAKRELSSSYLQQAEYEERDEKWLPAAKSYSRALAGRPEAAVYERVAYCLLSGEGDLREAGEAAKRAVLMQPDSARFRLTLAHFYAKAGMKQSAEGELSRAATLAPTDDKINDSIRRLKRELG